MEGASLGGTLRSRPRIVLGLDPGSRCTGYAVLQGTEGGYARIASGALRLDVSRPFPERLPELRDALWQVIQRYRPSEAALETCYVARGARAALVLGHVRGVLLLLCLEAGLPVYEYAPAEIKRAVTGEGAAPKPQVGAMLRRLVISPPLRPGADESDALAVAFCHLNRPALTRPRPLVRVP